MSHLAPLVPHSFSFAGGGLMKDFVSDRRWTGGTAALAMLAAAALLVSTGSPFAGLPGAGLAILLMTTTVMCLGRLGAVPSMARVIHAAAQPHGAGAQRGLGSRLSISASAAD
jgi:hypothetical protein